MHNSKTLYISFFDGIDLVKVNKFIQFTTEAINYHKPTELYYLISSGGGDVNAGFVLYNYLLSLQGQLTITMHNIGSIDSMANVIFLAGQRRYAAPTASFLFHGVAITIQGKYTVSAFREEMSKLEISEHRVIEAIGKHTKFTQDELMKLFSQGESKNAAYAQSKEVISEIKDPIIPADAIRLAMSFV